LPSHFEIVQAIELFQNGKSPTVPGISFRKDATFDLENEGRERKRYVESEFDRKREKVCPFIGKHDFSGYFYQVGIRNRNENTVAFWSVEEEKYKVLRSDVAMFGNIHSIFRTCRVSKAAQIILCRLLKIPALIYIDDAVNFAPTKRLHEAFSSAITKAYNKLGFCYCR